MDFSPAFDRSLYTPEQQEAMAAYLEEKGVNALLREVVAALCVEQPDAPLAFMVDQLQQRAVAERAADERRLREERQKQRDADEDHMDTSVVDEQPRHFPRRRRMAVSSEPAGEVENLPANQITPKSVDATARIDNALQSNILCAHLDENERREVVEVMFEVSYKANDVIIQQGDEEGDRFYIVDEGECDIFVEKDGERKHVLHVTAGGSFGELALIYNTPRAATVVATTDVRCFCIDRIMYRRVLMESTMRKRAMYESFLNRVPILQPLETYERLTVADALVPEKFGPGEAVVRQGEPGDVFYIIVEGTATVTKTAASGEPEVVARLGPSDYFGEIALLTDRPRAATVTTDGPLKCVRLDRERFNRVLGPCEDILRRNMQAYNQYMATQI